MTLDMLIDATRVPLDPDPRGTDAPLRALAVLLARGDASASTAATLHDALLARFDLSPHGTPIAALSALGDGLDPKRDYWLRIDPVCLQPTRTRMRLALLPDHDLTSAHADALAAPLRAHFAALGHELIVAHPHRWYLRCRAALDLVTYPSAACAGALTAEQLPSGRDGNQWRKWITEAQMLLHDLAPNREREARGQLPVNAIWPWGGGCLPSVRARSLHDVLSDDPLARGLGLAARCAVADLPPSAGALLSAAARDQSTLIVLETGTPQYRSDLDKRWFAPLLDALKHRRVTELTLVLVQPERAVQRRVVPWHLLRLWRSPRPLAAHD